MFPPENIDKRPPKDLATNVEVFLFVTQRNYNLAHHVRTHQCEPAPARCRQSRARSPCRRAHAAKLPIALKSESSLFGSFSLSQERKRKRTSGKKLTFYLHYNNFRDKTVSPLFFLTKKAQKEKFQKKNAAKKFRSLRRATRLAQP